MCDEFKQQGVFITDVFHCPELSGPDRKPEPGLFLKAEKKYNLNMKKCISIGDKERDIQAALTAGIGRNYLLNSIPTETKATQKISSFKEIEKFL